jgi:hypothetical protein
MQAMDLRRDAPEAFGFPQYTEIETTVDTALHLLALAAAIAAVGWRSF